MNWTVCSVIYDHRASLLNSAPEVAQPDGLSPLQAEESPERRKSPNGARPVR